MKVIQHEHKGCERFLDIDVSCLETPASRPIDQCLDRNGRRVLKRHATQAVTNRNSFNGTLTARWLDDVARKACMAEQTKADPSTGKSRWDDVERYISDYQHGILPPYPPVFLAPSLLRNKDSSSCLMLDGARRIMRLAEVIHRDPRKHGLQSLPCIILQELATTTT